MATAIIEFSTWLNDKLQQLNTDESVFGSYIQSIVDSDDSNEEKKEALEGILSEIVENEIEISKLCTEILDKWQLYKQQTISVAQKTMENVDEKLVKLLESQSLATLTQKKYTEEEKKIKNAILSQYGQLTDEEEDEPETVEHKQNGLEKNTNAQSVLQAEKVKREQAKLDSQKKKEKDKEDREKQKQQREEKKEKRKTQKQERKR